MRLVRSGQGISMKTLTTAATLLAIVGGPVLLAACQKSIEGTMAAYAPPGSIRRADPVARKDYEAWQPE